MDQKKINTFVHRITQLDAYAFDKEIHSLLMNNILEIRRYMKPGYLNNVMPEIDLFLKLVVFKYSVLKSNSTFGQQLLNVQYDKRLNGRKAILFFLLNYFIPYLKQKYDNAFLTWNNNKVKKMLDQFEIFIKICHFLNLLVFLKNGIFPTLPDRILGINIVPAVQQPRNLGYNYMTRELIWHGFMELFMYVLPLIDYEYIKRKLVTIFSSKMNEQTISKNISYKTIPMCSICGKQPTYPCRISLYCIHIACYYCIKSKTLEDDNYVCSSCGVKCTAHSNLQFINMQEKQ